MTTADGFLSPESTVTSLLASSGHLRSTLHPESSQNIWYNDKTYESASEALDAYIADFQRSQLTSEQSIGQLKIPKTPVTSHLSNSGFRNKDVLTESLTDRELKFLRLPVGARRQGPDRLSLSTDDLLVLPCDGSLPVTRTSAFLSQSGMQLPGHSSCALTPLRSQPRTTASHKSHSKPKHGCNPLRQSYCHWSSGRPKLSSTTKAAVKPSAESSHRVEAAKRSGRIEGILPGNMQPGSKPGHLDTSLGVPEGTPVVHHYPRWMTSQRSEMDFSGITSVPELKYPAWLQECDPPAEPSNGTQPYHPPVPSWLGELEESYQEINKKKQKDLPGHESLTCRSETVHRTQTTSLLQDQTNHLSVRELRLQFADKLTLEEDNQRHDNSQPFRDDMIESLILRAEKALNSPSLGISNQSQKQSSPGGTEEVLEADRSWDNPPVTFKSPVPVGVSDTPQKSEEGQVNVREETFCSGSSGYSSRKHPGPVEALKQMLFSLQAVEHKVAQDNHSVTEDDMGADKQTLLLQEHQALTEEVPNSVEDYGIAPGGESLQRALHHLGRLKHLVDDIKEKKERGQQAARNSHVT
ncbi:lung adenoma susceptibility protein 2 [Sardina pilchardus]|uniref:lung adenoma susceptibility protein 2 n=1 Tax=Sardina pilchardus TaxID=27697 RepID=UPI002E15B127